ncbi:TLD-domain-containing protein [Rhizophagus diaphanus]|nr:TLD-domain-containing protein [Rhizophagus diaphanus] [Rhizophagus sp. MUCL 43196]
MNYDQTQRLSTDLLHLRNDTSGCDVKILVGREPNIKEFKAHSLILSTRSNYFKTAFSPQWASKEDEFFISNHPDISPTVFEVLLNHIYSGKFSVDNNENKEISFVDILIASDKLGFLEIYQLLEKHLLERESAWKIPKDFITIFQFREDERFTNLYEVAIGLVCRNAKVIFDSKEFLEMEEEHLIQLLNRDDLKLEEIEIWDYLIKWGIENTDSILDENSTKWTLTDFEELEKTLHNCIRYVRFSQMSPKVFEIVRKQYKNILPEVLVDDVLQYFTDPNTKPSLKNLPLRVSAYPLDSKIINAQDAATIASWIDKKKGIPYRLKDMPIKFELIYRASLEGFSINRFHECCDNKGPTVVIIKVRNSGEIIGGYNPLDWRSMKENESIPHNNRDFYSDHKCKTSNSFIFSLSSLSNGVIPKLSQVKSKKEAIVWCKNKGPCFGLQDLWIENNSRSGKSKQKSYENKIIDGDTFDIEEYEVFQIIDDRFSPLKLFKKACNFTGKTIKGIIRFISNIKKETYEKLFIGSSVLGTLAFLGFIIYKFIMASILTKILVVFIIVAITAIIILICNKCQ